MKTKRDRRTYRRGRLIKDLADLMRQDFIFYVHNSRPINRGWFKSWQLHYAQSLIENRQLFRAVKNCGRIAKPLRNCDRFNGDHKMLYTAWFDWSGSPSGQNPDGTVKMTFAEWLLAPMQKGGAV